MPRRPAKPPAKSKAIAKPAKRPAVGVAPAAKKAGTKVAKKSVKKPVKQAKPPAAKKVAPKKSTAKAAVKAAPKAALKLALPPQPPKSLKFPAPRPAVKTVARKPAPEVAAKLPSPALPPPPAAHLPRPGESKTDWFARVAHDYYRFLYATALPITRNNDDAEDAVQNAVMSGIRRLDQLTEPGAIVSWLAMITKNAALDVLRRKKRMPGGGGDSTVLPIAAPDEKSEYAVADDMRSVLANAIATLPLSYQEVVNARHFDGQEVEDIAKRFGVTQNSIRVRLFRAYEKLRESAQVRRALGLPAEAPAGGE